MRKSSNDLYRLIHALSKSEKRYFTLFAQQRQVGEQSSYLQLFQTIKTADVHNDEALQTHIRQFSFAGHLAVTKKQLMDNLLKALCHYQEDTTVDESIKQLCHKANILLEKGLERHAEKYLRKAEQKAIQYERFHLILEVIEIRKRIIAQQYYNKTSFDELEDLYQKTAHYQKILDNKNKYWLLFSCIYKLHFRKTTHQKPADQQELTDLMQSPLLSDEKFALSASARLDYLKLNALRYFIQQKPQKALTYNQRFLDVFNEQPFLLQTQPGRYLSTLNNFLIDCVQLNKETAFFAGLKKLRTLPQQKAFKKKKDTEIHVFRLGYQLEMNWNISKGNFHENCDLVPAVKEKLAAYGDALVEQNRVVFYYLIAYSWFGIGNFSQCLDWTNKIIQETNEKVMEGLQSAARILHALSHYELEHTEYLAYSIENLRRYIRKRAGLSGMEKTLLSGLHQLLNQTPDKHAAIYTKMLKDFAQTSESEYFKASVWVQAKLEKRTYESVYSDFLE